MFFEKESPSNWISEYITMKGNLLTEEDRSLLQSGSQLIRVQVLKSDYDRLKLLNS